MKFDQIWNQLVNKDNDLARDDATVEFRSDNLKQLLRQVYEQGEKHGSEKAARPFPNIFGGF